MYLCEWNIAVVKCVWGIQKWVSYEILDTLHVFFCIMCVLKLRPAWECIVYVCVDVFCLYKLFFSAYLATYMKFLTASFYASDSVCDLYSLCVWLHAHSCKTEMISVTYKVTQKTEWVILDLPWSESQNSTGTYIVMADWLWFTKAELGRVSKNRAQHRVALRQHIFTRVKV